VITRMTAQLHVHNNHFLNHSEAPIRGAARSSDVAKWRLSQGEVTLARPVDVPYAL
jgi:hypothetical protein